MESVRQTILSMDSYKVARHILQQEILVLKSLDIDILLPSAKESRAKEIKRDLILRYYFQGSENNYRTPDQAKKRLLSNSFRFSALLLIGDSSQCCLLLDKSRVEKCSM